MASRILHVTTARLAAAARGDGAYRQSTRGRTLDDVGFVHASTSAQVRGVAARYYADETDPLVLLVIDVATCTAAGSPVAWEPVPGAGVFPHVQGPIPWAAVVAELPVAFAGGELEIPDLTPYDVVADPPLDRRATRAAPSRPSPAASAGPAGPGAG